MTVAQLLVRIPVFGDQLIDLARRIRNPTVENAVDADWQQTIADTEWLRRAMPVPSRSAPILLIISLSDMVYQLKLEGMLASAMKLRGWRPIVLTNSRTNTRARRFFGAFGLDEFVYLDEFTATEDERRQADEAARRFLGGPMDFRTVKAWNFEKSWVGPQVLSTVSRLRHEGAPDPQDLRTRAEIEALLRPVLERILIARRMIARYRPQLGMVIEANYVLNSPFVDGLVDSGTDVIQVTQPWRDDSLIFKRLNRTTRRMHPSSVSLETFDRLMAQPWTVAEEAELDQVFADRYSGTWFLQARNQAGTMALSRSEIVDRLGLDPEKKTATVFSHVLWDANLFYGDDLFDDYGDWFIETVRAAIGNPRLNWIIKLHPANLWKRARDGHVGEFSELILIRERLGELPAHVRILPPDTDVSTASLFSFTDYGITVRGTTGMELPCYGKPVITAGTGRYSGLGFTVDSASREEYLARLAKLPELPMMRAADVERARRHAHAAFVRRPWQMKSFRSVFDYRKEGHHPLDHNLLCQAESLEAARKNGDLDRWASWAPSDQIDYLESPA